ncbi:hypothetical protein RRG08_064016 [Elysia crispata]|uniref:Uncharacterized protein n=1 Tax=Elysia crispata TaxID=231223 RepID=A0AAE0YF32_9GAST|nr:hypothetical protein RRG08_064016 [Elysia crispata]
MSGASTNDHPCEAEDVKLNADRSDIKNTLMCLHIYQCGNPNVLYCAHHDCVDPSYSRSQDSSQPRPLDLGLC